MSTTAPTDAAPTATGVVEGAATPTPTVVAPPAATLLPTPADGSSPTLPPAATPLPTAPPPSATPVPATSPTPTLPPPPPGQERDPDYETALRVAGISTRRWLTDFTLHTVPYSEIRSGGPGRDGIPPIDSPKFATFEEAGEWLRDDEPVIVFEHAGDARAYPLQILIWHEIVNDVVGGLPVAITFCPLCNSAIAFDRNFEGEILDFGTTGNLRNSDLIMWDRQTESWWQQFTGEGIVGVHSGKRLALVPSAINSWADFRAAYPGGKVLSRNTGFERDYGINPYLGYDRADNPPFLYNGPTDGRLPPKERVVAVSIGGEDAAYPFTLLEVERAVNDVVGGESIAVFFKPGTRSALDGTIIAQSRDVGATGAFRPLLAPCSTASASRSRSTARTSSTTRRGASGISRATRSQGHWKARPSKRSCTATTSGLPGASSSQTPGSTAPSPLFPSLSPERADGKATLVSPLRTP